MHSRGLNVSDAPAALWFDNLPVAGGAQVNLTVHQGGLLWATHIPLNRFLYPR
jgi:hypothetical protein